MHRHTALVAALALGACIEVPPEAPLPDNPHKATAVVDPEGRTLRGGNLTLVIPAGAVHPGDQIRVTVDAISGTPAGVVGEAYIVEPQDYPFALPLELSYRYTTGTRDRVVDATKLLLGEARFDQWEPLADQQHDLDARRITAQVQSLGVFGVVDPLATQPDVDAGPGHDASAAVDAGTGHDASVAQDSGSADATPGPLAVQVMLTWDNGYDLDLHLVRTGGAAFSTTDDCYYATRSGLDWLPAGPVNDPTLDIDDMDGFGPESISIAQAASGSYSVGVHVYDRKSLTTPATFTVAILVDGVEVQRASRQADTCDQFFWLLDFTVVSSHLAASLRSDAPVFFGKAFCQ